jgi:ketosteroid isomerase-like protein
MSLVSIRAWPGGISSAPGPKRVVGKGTVEEPLVRRLSPVTCFALLWAASLSACAATQMNPERAAEASVQAEIQARINEGLDATRAGDTQKFLARLPADFVIERPDGSITTREQLAQRMAGRAQNPPETISLAVDIERLDLAGDQATVMTAQRWERLVRRPGEEKPRHVISTQRHEELWGRRNGRWEGYRIKELGGTLTINGVPQERTGQ